MCADAAPAKIRSPLLKLGVPLAPSLCACASDAVRSVLLNPFGLCSHKREPVWIDWKINTKSKSGPKSRACVQGWDALKVIRA